MDQGTKQSKQQLPLNYPYLSGNYYSGEKERGKTKKKTQMDSTMRHNDIVGKVKVLGSKQSGSLFCAFQPLSQCAYSSHLLSLDIIVSNWKMKRLCIFHQVMETSNISHVSGAQHKILHLAKAKEMTAFVKNARFISVLEVCRLLDCAFTSSSEWRQYKAYTVENFYIHPVRDVTIYKLLHINYWTLSP